MLYAYFLRWDFIMLNILSYLIGFGTFGQYMFYGHIFPNFPGWILFAFLSVPWLTMFIITFFSRCPFEPKIVRLCVLIAFIWYVIETGFAEVLYRTSALYGALGVSVVLARFLMYIAFIGFIIIGAFVVHRKGRL